MRSGCPCWLAVEFHLVWGQTSFCYGNFARRLIRLTQKNPDYLPITNSTNFHSSYEKSFRNVSITAKFRLVKPFNKTFSVRPRARFILFYKQIIVLHKIKAIQYFKRIIFGKKQISTVRNYIFCIYTKKTFFIINMNNFKFHCCSTIIWVHFSAILKKIIFGTLPNVIRLISLVRWFENFRGGAQKYYKETLYNEKEKIYKNIFLTALVQI